MAKPASFGKRDNEKKKQQKKQEKQKRKEDRKANTSKGSSLEEMFVYVDENGMLTSTPPDQQKKKEEIDLESIEISIPKREDSTDETTIYKGIIERFFEQKGYGFIKESKSGKKYFFHISAITGNVNEGQTVFFELEQGPRDLNAVRIHLEDESSSL